MVQDEFSDREEQARIYMAANQLDEREWDADAAWLKVQKQVARKSGRNKILFFRYVAIGLVLLTAGVGVWLFPQTRQIEVAQNEGIPAVVGIPELILATGEKILLDSSETTVCLQQPGAVLYFDSLSRQLQYQQAAGTLDSSLVFNQLRVPKGGEYSLILADGSKVWLNAESCLQYPVKFGKDKREVFLEGEAYFEVARDEHCPFCVSAGDRKVEVLGTSFNVSAYQTDACWNATLVTGKVKITSGEVSTVLMPSQQYREDNKTGKGEVCQVDVQEYVSWRSGIIRFRGERLEDIIRKLSRWYDFDIFYTNDELRDMRFRGVINKYNSFEVVLKNLEQTTNIRFEIKGNTVTASKIYAN